MHWFFLAVYISKKLTNS